jgi:hypothetical protein
VEVRENSRSDQDSIPGPSSPYPVSILTELPAHIIVVALHKCDDDDDDDDDDDNDDDDGDDDDNNNNNNNNNNKPLWIQT